ncbi:DUF6161 domain-containing protein [Marinobacter shengliensis]|uniref:DUF6161 domain-containing protein n=1 Tax=Marinobacter shengliensis TaxID=1389223 RepID=UPI000D0E528D|nr:DUF6161 domain-containing protein [Marinobacter shengliensis]PSF10801.1 hypothetical protein C7H10_13490 [Marinobacter shengliensis]
MNQTEIDVKFHDATGQLFEFQGIRALQEFLRKEQEFWVEQTRLIDSEGSAKGKQNKHTFLSSNKQLQPIVQMIDSWLPQLDSWNSDKWTQEVRNLKQQVQNLKPQWFWSGHPACDQFIALQKEYGADAADAFFAIVFQSSVKATSREAFIGSLVGYEFFFQDSDLLRRRKSEKAAFSRLRDSLSKSEKSLIDEVESFKADFSEWDRETRAKTERLYDLNKRIGERRLRQHDKSFQEHLHNWNESIADLESTYEEKLKLEKPAQYWKRAADKYRTQGRWWAATLLIALSAGLLAIGAFFLSWLEGQQIGVSLSTLQGIAIFGTFGAVFAFLVRVLSKLVFSSFHLMRDAEEREQLTYLYLSLTKEAEIHKDSRDVILQALFSRTDSGLLGGDSSPTMPSTSDALRVLSRNRGS